MGHYRHYYYHLNTASRKQTPLLTYSDAQHSVGVDKFRKPVKYILLETLISSTAVSQSMISTSFEKNCSTAPSSTPRPSPITHHPATKHQAVCRRVLFPTQPEAGAAEQQSSRAQQLRCQQVSEIYCAPAVPSSYTPTHSHVPVARHRPPGPSVLCTPAAAGAVPTEREVMVLIRLLAPNTTKVSCLLYLLLAIKPHPHPLLRRIACSSFHSSHSTNGFWWLQVGDGTFS